MKTKIALDGAIGESTPLFTMRMETLKELDLDMSKTTYINSIGVKHWVVWTLRIPKDCKVRMHQAPFVLVSQASQVVGFVNPAMTFESIRAPYACDSCSHEEIRQLTRGKDYEYASPGQASWTKFGGLLVCTKCRKETLEPDFLAEKSFKFL